VLRASSSFHLVVAAAGLALSALLAGPGCVRTVPHPDGARCEAETPEDAAVCDGGVCFAFQGPNAQDMPGMCTRSCTLSQTCEDGGVCLGPFSDQGYYCLKACQSSFDCYDGAACVAGSVTNFCWVTPT
jgi:hypothetical protein